MAKIKLPDNQELELPDEIAKDDEQLRNALAPYAPDVRNAKLTRSTKDGVMIVTVVKQAGTLGSARGIRFTAAIEDASTRPLHPNVPDRGPLAPSGFSPKPSEIKMDGHFWNAFENNETEISAWWLVELARKHGDWRPFTREEIEQFYGQKHKDGFTFNRLIERGVGYGMPGQRYLTGGGWIVPRDGLLHFTEEFVMRCYLSSNDKKEELNSRFPESAEPREYF